MRRDIIVLWVLEVSLIAACYVGGILVFAHGYRVLGMFGAIAGVIEAVRFHRWWKKWWQL